MQICAGNPRYTSEDELSEDEKRNMLATLAEEARRNYPGKPENVLYKIAQGKFRKWKEENVLLDQFYVRDQNISVQQLIYDLVVEVKENIVIKRWVRFQIGQRDNRAVPK
jgi:elongation factor Ts